MSTFLRICYLLNALLILQVLSTFFAAILGMDAYLDLSFHNQTFNIIRSVASFFTFVFWIYLLVVWSKNDKHMGRFLLLFFLIGSYTLFITSLQKRKIG